jgi:phosphoadenosine phosphosulfate reductase
MSKVLQFSGGLDSLACLHFLRNEKGLIVLTLSTDGQYPSRRDYLNKVKDAHPHLEFVEWYGDRQIHKYGHPVDVIPIKFTTIGKIIQGGEVRYQPYTECCNRGIWLPMADTTRKLGATEVYRGQRDSDEYKSPIRHGHVEEGITYYFPIQEWSREQVKEYVWANCPDLIPDYYNSELTSQDCWDCTAYLKDNIRRIKNLPEPQKNVVENVLRQWRKDIDEETRW